MHSFEYLFALCGYGLPKGWDGRQAPPRLSGVSASITAIWSIALIWSCWVFGATR